MKRTLLRKVSNKQRAKLAQYNVLVKELRNLCNNRSELSGEQGDWRSDWNAEPHHINGRIGKRLIDPFNIILLIRAEHDNQDGNGWERKQELLKYIKPIRLKQGFRQVKS